MRFGEHAASHMLGHIVAHDEFSAHNAMRFGVAAALIFAGPVVLSHVGGEGLDDGLETFFFARQGSFLGEFEALVPSAHVHYPLDGARRRLAKDRIERRPKKRIDPAHPTLDRTECTVRCQFQPGRGRQRNHRIADARRCSPSQQSSATASPRANAGPSRAATSALKSVKFSRNARFA